MGRHIEIDEEKKKSIEAFLNRNRKFFEKMAKGLNKKHRAPA